jgi:hypothetical protein
MKHEWFTLGMHLGYRYEKSPICVPDGTPPMPDDPMRYIPTTRPGSRAPHVWLADGRSTLDLFGRGFVLMRIGPAAPEAQPLVAAAQRRRVPLKVVAIDEPAVTATYENALVLVRPDGHVAWRGDTLLDPQAIIDTICGLRAQPRFLSTQEPPKQRLAQLP